MTIGLGNISLPETSLSAFWSKLSILKFDMKKIVAVVQSNYIPWKGFFDLINFADEFILYDDVQYTRRDWRNRNKIKSRDGLIWLTIPLMVKGRYHQKIRDAVISDSRWNRKHWNSIVSNYSRARYFPDYREMFEALYLGCNEKYLSHINHRFMTAICQTLGIKTQISWVMDYHLSESGKTERIIEICKKARATDYVVGPAARDYMNEELFKKEGIHFKYMDYSGYPEYRQLFPPFKHGVSIIDLVLNEGPDSYKYLKSFQPKSKKATGGPIEI